MVDLDLEELERAVDAALATPDQDGLHVLGYGEISCVIAWPRANGPWACKRLPNFDTRARLEAYRAVFDAYLAELSTRGVSVHDTKLETLRRPDGRISAYCVQAVLPRDSLATERLRVASEDAGRDLLTTIIDHIARVSSPTLGIDGQLSNWACTATGLVYFDVTTPLLRDDAGRDLLDTELFLTSLPAIMRPVVRRFLLDGILDPYFTPRAATLDLLSNLHKERLAEWVPAGVEIANERLDTDLTAEEADRYSRRDARLWGALQEVRRLDRAWQRRVRRRSYEFLVPPRIDRRPDPNEGADRAT